MQFRLECIYIPVISLFITILSIKTFVYTGDIKHSGKSLISMQL